MPIQSKKKQAQRRRRTFWVILLLLTAVLAGWWLWRDRMSKPPRFQSMTVQVNQESRTLFPGETLFLHPNDRVKILSISTNVPLNLNVRLSAEGIDASALRYETLRLSDLLPRRDIFDRYRFDIHVKHYNEDLGGVSWIVQPYAEDWLDKADRIIDKERRISLLERGLELIPGNSQIERRLIDEYKALKKWDRAAAMLERIAAKKADDALLSELLSVYRQLNDTTGIQRILEKRIQLNPDNVEAKTAYVKTLEASEEWERAIRVYESLLMQLDEIQRLEAYKRLGYLYTQTEEFEKAIGAYLNAANLDQRDANLHYNLSYLYEKTGQQEKADFYLDNALTLKSDDLEGRLKLAQRLLERGSCQKARAYLAEVLEKAPESTTALVMLAQVLEKTGDREALKTVYRQILALDPGDETLTYNLGALEYETGNFKAARPYFEAYAATHPEDADVHAFLFDIYKKENDTEAAFKEAVKMVELRPGDADVYHFIYDYLEHKGSYDALIPLLEKGVKAHPREISFRRYLISAYLKTGETDAAIRQMQALIAEKPQDLDYLLEAMFEHLRSAKAYGDIIRMMQQAAKANPENPNVRGYLIFAYLQIGKEGPAMEQMAELLKLRPDDLDLWLQLARLREKLDDIAGAAKAYKRALGLSPEHPEASEAYLRLRLKGVGGADGE